MTVLDDRTSKKRLPRTRTLVVSLMAMVAMTGGAVATASPAAAAPGDPYASYIGSNSGGANWRTCASSSCGLTVPDGYLRNGATVYMLCYWDGQTVSPPNSDYTSARWFEVGIPYNNHVGFVHSSLVDNQKPNVPRCSSGSI